MSYVKEKRKNDLICFSVEIAGEMIDRGFEMIGMRPDFKDPSKRVYFFARTSESEKAFYSLVERKKMENAH